MGRKQKAMKPVEITDASFEAEVLKSTVPVVVDFWAPWCGPCRMMAPVLDAAAEKLGGPIKFAKMNTDDNPKMPGRFQIMAIPSLLVFDQGEEKDRAVGFVPAPQLEQWLKSFAPAPGEKPAGQG
jgi:thioredoxin 1